MRPGLREQQMPWGFSQFDFKVLNISQENCGSRWYLGAVEGLLAKCAGLGNGSRFLFSSCNCREQPWWILGTFQHMTGGQTPQDPTDLSLFSVKAALLENTSLEDNSLTHCMSSACAGWVKTFVGFLSFYDEFIFDFLKHIAIALPCLFSILWKSCGFSGGEIQNPCHKIWVQWNLQLASNPVDLIHDVLHIIFAGLRNRMEHHPGY